MIRVQDQLLDSNPLVEGKSGTNDKAGDINLLFRLFNQRNLKINLAF